MPQSARSHTTPFVALALTLSVGVVGIPASSQAAQPPAPTLLIKQEPAPSEPMPAEQQPPRAALRVDTKALRGDDALEAKIVEVATNVFTSEGFADALDDEDPRIVIVVEKTGGEENPGFVVGYSIEKGTEVVPGSARQSDCSLCTKTELVERIEKELPGLLELALDHQVVRTIEGGGNGDVGGDGDGDGDGDVGGGDQRKIGPLGFAGIGLGVAGLAGVGVGVGLAVKGVEPIPPIEKEIRDYRTPGNVILAVGGAALIAGIVMIAVDVSKRKKARAHRAARVQPLGSGFAF
ncbi:MAG TPA: hypothetical protein VK034_25810 [Enhygromyxa sp.]|nr:hypothetical protein [Enhygromyxa sp.]